MENFTIYKEGQYDYIANLKIKLKKKLPVVIKTVDNFFENH